MRRALAGGSFAVAVIVASVALAATSGGATPLTLGRATVRTSQVSSQHYAVNVQITKGTRPLTLHIRGASAARTIAVILRMNDVTLPDGTVVPGPTGAEVLDGPFLYERAPGAIALYGNIRWLRVPLSQLRSTSSALRTLHALTPAPLLRVLSESRAVATRRSANLYRGPVAYDDPVVRTALSALTGGIEFRHLRVIAWVGRDGLVHGLHLSGRTADGSATLGLSARFYGFGRPVHVRLPAQGTFMDKQRDKLPA